jgi:predicted ATPase/class 3 adenylate cyclase/Flp pilus assembly protein TadD
MTGHALLFTDVVDSTRLVERLGDARAGQLWSVHDQRSRALLVRHRGREIDRTDGFFLLFDHAIDAARFAVDYHDVLRELALDARVGIHVGPISLRENPLDDIARGAKPLEVEGLAKPLAARVMSLARGGQTLVTAAVRDALGDALPDGAVIARHGHYRLKGIDEPVEIFELGVGTGSPFMPPVDADKAYRVVRNGDLWSPAREVRQNLPAEPNQFVGRDAELRALATHLDNGTRLITVLGPGGTGKTRLVRRYGLSWLGDWPGGVYFCDLSEARSRDGIFFAVASALEVPLGRDDAAVQLGHALASRRRCLVILDNFEQVVEHAAATVGCWLDRTAQAAFIVTSRERLHLAGEEVFPIEPLPVEEDAIELFAARARAQRPDFVLTEANRGAVAEVARLLDGLPLAIELAAARVRVLSPMQLVERMRDRFTLLAGGTRGAAARQATLRGAIDWSWDLLAPWEQGALAQCAVFEGGFTLDAAEQVIDLSAWHEAPAVMDVVQALADKSLLRTWVPAVQGRHAIDEPCFGMYISIREYAADKLESSGPGPRLAAEQRHGRWYAGFGTDEAIESLLRDGGMRLHHALALALDNLVAACRRAARRGDATIAAAAYRAVWDVLETRGPISLGIALGTEVLAIDGIGDTDRAAALCATAGAMRRASRTGDAGDRLEEALALSRRTGNERQEAQVRNQLGNLRRVQGRVDEAVEHLEAALATWRKAGDRAHEGVALGNLGIVNAVQGRLAQARTLFEQAITIHREVGNRLREGVESNNLGSACRESGRFDEARAHLTLALAIQREAGNRREEAIVVGNLAGLTLSVGGPSNEVRSLFETAIALSREVGDRQIEAAFLGDLAEFLRAQGAIDEALDRCEQALEIHRAGGDRRSEGTLLGLRASLLEQRGQFVDARESLRIGEALLREARDHLGQAKLLCAWARSELAAGDRPAARAALAAAETLASETGAGADSELGRDLATLRDALV